MMEEKVSRLNNYFDRQIASCQQRQKELLADDRNDEAMFEKVKANVYDIFRTILSVAVKNCPGDPEKSQRFFARNAEQIPSNWETAYKKAAQHNDVVKMRIEQIKLETVHEIQELFTQVWEEEP